MCLCPSLSCIFNDLMFCELLKLCKQFELSATMRQQQQQLRQQLPLLQRRQQKVAQSFLMLFGAPSLVSSLVPWTTRSAWHRKCNFNEAFKWQLLYLPPATAPATVAVDDASDLGTHTRAHTHGREGVMQLLLLLLGECQACPGNDFESVGQMSYLKMLLAQVIKGNYTKFLSVIDNQN